MQVELSPFQIKVNSIPEDYDLFLGGGRGGAKSWTIALLCLRHAEQYGAQANMLYIRKTHGGTADFRSSCLDIFSRVYGSNIRYNATAGLFTFPNGATLEINQMEGEADYAKFQGRSFTLILADEVGQYASPLLLDRLRSNLRGPKKIPLRMVVAANPGGVGHHWIAARYVFKTAPWSIFEEEHSGKEWVHAPSTFLDNPFIDQAQYKAQLEASAPTDPELLRSWLEGDWSIARGAYFAHVLEESRNAIEPWVRADIPNWELYLAHDFGSSAPSATYVCAESPGADIKGRYYPKDSIVLVDEFASNKPGSLTEGMGWVVPELAEVITGKLCKPWGIDPRMSGHVADDAIFSQTGLGTIAEEFSKCGISFGPAHKGDRIQGWEKMRRMLKDAGKPDVPGLYVSRSCEYFWQTVPYLGRCPKRVEDLDTTGPDHGADAVRYGLLRQKFESGTGRLGFGGNIANSRTGRPQLVMG